MAIEVAWDNPERTVVYYGANGLWDWQEFYAKTDELYQMVKGVPHPVDVIMDFSGSVMLSTNTLSHFQTVMRRTPSNLRSYIFVGMNGFQQAVLSVLRHLVPDELSERFMYAEGVNEARLIILDSQQATMTG